MEFEWDKEEYDFTDAVRGKHHRAYRRGYTVTVRDADGTTTTTSVEPEPGTIVLEPDVREYFADSEAVNRALRALIALIPERKQNGGQ